MLKELHIQNLILVSSATIPFYPGFNVLSGETGAGKSAIMKALYLLAGEKTDFSVVRHGTEKAIVEGLFDIDGIPELIPLLAQLNIDHEEGESLIIRREVALTGKGKCVINNQTTQLASLRKIGAVLFEMVGQHANQKLLSLEHHRLIIDLFGGHQKDVAQFAKSWEKENQLANELDGIVKNESQRLREIDIFRAELEELNEAGLKEGEEEELFLEYSRLANADEISTKLTEITETLNGERLSILTLLKKHTHLFDQLIKLDPEFKESASAHKNATIELQEVAYNLERLRGRIEDNPGRLETISERLAVINKLKRKYGDSVAAIQAYKASADQKLKALESSDTRLEEGKAALIELRQSNSLLADKLTLQRKTTANKLSNALTEQLRGLNMPKVVFEIDLKQQHRTSSGDDLIEFFLTPNIGEKCIPIREHASGGELSRVLLALQTLLAGKQSVSTLVFDEIDANIGGTTSVVIGDRLGEIGKNHQVLCITHFPQVARRADYHIQIEKKEEEGRTLSYITPLDAEGRKRELDRMSGVPAVGGVEK